MNLDHITQRKMCSLEHEVITNIQDVDLEKFGRDMKNQTDYLIDNKQFRTAVFCSKTCSQVFQKGMTT